MNAPITLSGKGKRSPDSRDGCFKGDATHFLRDFNASKQAHGQTNVEQRRSEQVMVHE